MQRHPDFQFFHFPISDGSSRKLAYEYRSPDDPQKPTLMWLQGFRSHMQSEKASIISDWTNQNGYGFLRFDYSGLGLSEGDFEQVTISDWLEEAWTLFSQKSRGPVLLLGSSMGGWIALLMIKRLMAERPEDLERIKGCVMIAPAWDFTEKLVWDRFPDDLKQEVKKNGAYYHQSVYEAKPYPITYKLIEDGRKYLLEGAFFKPHCPIRILHGLQDKDVPFEHSVKLCQGLTSEDIILELIKDGEHRLSRPQDMKRFIAFITELTSF